jgi:hypothetical protein
VATDYDGPNDVTHKRDKQAVRSLVGCHLCQIMGLYDVLLDELIELSVKSDNDEWVTFFNYRDPDYCGATPGKFVVPAANGSDGSPPYYGYAC